MSAGKGFTLIEICVVMIIIGILVCIAMPNYYNAVTTSQLQAAEHNLMAIYAAQQKYYEDYGYYCGTPTTAGVPKSGCSGGWNTATQSINQDLGLNLPSPQKTPGDTYYYCVVSAIPTAAFGCVAQNGEVTGFTNDIFFRITNNPGVTFDSLCGTPPQVGVPLCGHQGNDFQLFNCP